MFSKLNHATANTFTKVAMASVVKKCRCPLFKRHPKTAILSQFSTLVLATVVSACSQAPFDAPEDRRGYPTVSGVVDKIECEILEASRDTTINGDWVKTHLAAKNPGLMPFEDWVAAVTITLTITDTEGLTPSSGGPSLAVIDPLKVASSTFTFGANPVFYQQKTRTFSEQYTTEISRIDPRRCNHKWNSAFNLEGDLGIRDNVYLGLHSITTDQADNFVAPSGGTSPDNFTATIEFDIYKGISNLGPTFSISRFKGPTGGLGYVREDLHKVVITFQAQERPSSATSKLMQQSPNTSKVDTLASAKMAAVQNNSDHATRAILHEIVQAINKP
jgi:hypothetical protein